MAGPARISDTRFARRGTLSLFAFFLAALLVAGFAAAADDAAPAGAPSTVPDDAAGTATVTMAAGADAEADSTDGADSAAAAENPYRPVTLSAKGLDIRDVLSMFSRSRGLNIVSSGDIVGTVSMDLNEVPFDQAMQAIVGMAGFQATRRGDVYYVRRPNSDEGKGSFLRGVRTYRLDYAQPDQVKPVVDQMISPDGATSVYPPLRSLVVEDWPEVLERVDAVVDALDRPPRQVIIEARLIEARMSNDMRVGIDWDAFFSNIDGSGGASLDGFVSNQGSGTKGLFLSWGSHDFETLLQGLEGVEELNTLAAPKLLTVDGTSAEIIIGEQIGFRVVTTVENVVMETVQFLDVGVKMQIVPIITEDGYILMKVKPELSSGQVEAGLPSKTTAQVATDVLVKDGQTLLIGGLLQEREEKSESGIPILRRIPLLGWFFGEHVVEKSKSELITLITPRILQPGESVDY